MADQPKNDAADQPLKDPKVDVAVEPKRGDDGNEHHAEKVKAKIEKEVKKALEDNKRGGWKKQLDAADDAAKKAGSPADPKKVERPKVTVTGEDPDGHEVSRTTKVKPDESKR